jgi:hypothetical protein
VGVPNPFPGDATQLDALKNVMNLGLTGFSVGAGTRSLLGLRDMFAKSMAKNRRTTQPAVVEVAVPRTVEEDEESEAVPAFQRRLGPKMATAPYYVPEGMTGPPTLEPTFLDRLFGRRNVPQIAKPWFMPAAIGIGAGSIYGGYKAVDHVLGGLHKQDRQREMEEAKNEYRKALVEQYSADSPNIKRAESLGNDLSELYQLYKKGNLNDAYGTALGGYLSLAGLLAGGTGLATYAWAKGRSPEERLAKAIQQRERLRWATRPPEIYAVAKPTPVRLQTETPKGSYSPASEEDEAEVRKIAAQIATYYKP